MAQLYVTATPIGNLQDFSPRAIETLKKAAFIAAEDTRVTMKLCQVFDIHTPLIACHMHNESSKGEELAEKMLREDLDAALVTDAGTPCISDPGNLFVRACLDRGIEVLPVPGPVAGAAALSVSGFECREWKFYGFLPREKKELDEKLKAMPSQTGIAVVHESPYRILFLMERILEVLPDAKVSVSCDLTKLHELTLRGSVGTVLQKMRENAKTERGEYCVVLDLTACPKAEEPEMAVEIPLTLRLVEQMLKGISFHDAQQLLCQQGEKKNAVKSAALEVKRCLLEDEIW